jgi:hypothetical protein
MVVVRNIESEHGEERIVAKNAIPAGFAPTDVQYAAGQIYLQTDKGERRASGSYYTPNHIVDYIVESTLSPLCGEIDLQARTEQQAAAGSLGRPDFSERLLAVRVIDPAMGSGHFLIKSCQYLAEQIATNPGTRHPGADALRGDESILTYWKRRVAEACLFGVDKNPLAVELAKLALWLETVAADQPLTYLDNNLREGDSIFGASIHDLGNLPDAPPLIRNQFQEQVQNVLPTLLEAVTRIRELPSETVAQVAAKKTILRTELDPKQTPFRTIANLWCSTFNKAQGALLQPAEYGRSVELLASPRRLKALLRSSPYAQLMRDFQQLGVKPFHWELEFPDVFLAGRRGFDAVVGNPPYDVLSDKETGHDLSYMRSFLRGSLVMRPSFKGKNNLYKLFICRAVGILSAHGRVGFICPMALLGDEQASGIRKCLLGSGAFAAIESFPQKDDARRRVFRDAKLSTAVFIFEKGDAGAPPTARFRLRVHPSSRIEANSPGLVLSAQEIPLYDPANMTIVSCAQEDWDIAARIMQTGRMQRLGDVCVSFQGEVNEKTDGDRGALSSSSTCGPQVLRGSNVCMYALRSASQGDSLFLRESVFLQGKGAGAKAHHSQEPRAGFQRSSPQNNFRRLVACLLPPNSFCFDTISYVPRSRSQIPLTLIVALLNSKLLDWYFRLGSTNSKVNEYQFNNLPCPIFSDREAQASGTLLSRAFGALGRGERHVAAAYFGDLTGAPPFSLTVAKAMTKAARRVCAIERKRGEISRRERSKLADDARPYQDFIDELLFAMAGITEPEAEGLEKRLKTML